MKPPPSTLLSPTEAHSMNAHRKTMTMNPRKHVRKHARILRPAATLPAAALLTAGLLMPATGADAAPLFEESFDYTAGGDLTTASSNVWSAGLVNDNNSSGNPPNFDVGSGSLNFSRNGNAVVTAGNTAAAFVQDSGDDLAYSRSLGQTFDSGTVWFGWLQVNSPGSNQDTFLMLGNKGVDAVTGGGNSDSAQIFFGRDASSSNNLAYATAGSTAPTDTGVNGVTTSKSDADAPSAAADFLVVSIDFDADEASFYVNPDPLDISDNDFSVTGVTFGGSSISHVSIYRENDHFGGDFNGWFDEIRAGESFLDVTGIPEPGSLALLGLGGLLMLGRGRRA